VIPRHRALALLSECTGDEIWSIEHCRAAGVPDAWIDSLSDAFESGFRSDRETIYVENGKTNQYHGVRDVDLALKLADLLGLDATRIAASTPHRRSIVVAIKNAIMEGD
jgi:hypothetical protein